MRAVCWKNALRNFVHCDHAELADLTPLSLLEVHEKGEALMLDFGWGGEEKNAEIDGLLGF